MKKDPNLTASAWVLHHVNYDSDFCLIFPFFRDPNGYGTLRHNGKTHYAHRLMCELVNGPAPSREYEAAHSCGNGDEGCANPRHLSWKTKAGNRQDSMAHGTGIRNTTGPHGKLTHEEVLQIKGMKGTKTHVEIAAMFGISAPSVRAIFTGKMYAKPKINHWTADEDDKIRIALAQGLSFSQTARVVGRPAGATYGRACRLGLKSAQART